MPYQLATLIWFLLFVSVIFSAGLTFATFGVASDEGSLGLFLAAVGGTFLTVTIAWGMWAMYSMTAMGM